MPPEDNSLEGNPNSAYSSSLETAPPQVQTVVVQRGPTLMGFNKLAFKITGGAVLAILLIAGAAFGFNSIQTKKANEQAAKKGSYAASNLSLSDVKSNDQLNVGTADSLSVNGRLQVSNTVVLSPGEAPATPETGQIYYDKTVNSLFYYNGSVFVPVANQNAIVSSLGGLTGAVNTGAGISAVGGSLQNTGVLSVQGQTGIVNFTAGGGVTISGTTISTTALPAGQLVLGTGVSGFTTVAAASMPGQCLVSTSGAPVFGSCTGTTQVTSLNNLVNGLTLSAGAGINITDNGSNTITITSTAGAAITSVNGQNGPSLTVANATATSNTITINNAQANGSTKGIAAFNSTNFSDSSGVINTIQGISTSSSPSFTNLTTSGYVKTTALRNATDVVFTLPVAGSGTTRTLCYIDNGNNSNCPTGGNVSYGTTHTNNKIAALDSSGDLVDSELSTLSGGLQYAGSSYLLDIVSGSNSTLTVDNSGAGVANLSVSGKITASLGFLQGGDTYILPSNSGNGGTLCYVYAGNSNCPTGGNVSSSGSHTAGVLAMFSGTGQNIGDSVLSQSSNNLTSTGSFKVTKSSVTALQIQDASNNDVLIVDTTNGLIGIKTAPNSNLAYTPLQINGGLRVMPQSVSTIPTADVNNNGTIYYDNTDDAFYIIEEGTAKKLCNTTDQGCGAGENEITLQGAYDNGNGMIQTSTTAHKDIVFQLDATQNSNFLTNILGSGRFAVQLNGADKFGIDYTGITAKLGLKVESINGLTIGVAGPAGIDGVLKLANGTNDQLVKISAAPPSGTGDVLLSIPTVAGNASYDICLSSGNCAGSGGGITGSGSANIIAMFNSSGTITNSTLTQSSGNLSATGDLTLQGGDLTLGVANTQTGSIAFNRSDSGFTGTLIQGTLTGNQTYTLPDGSGDICLSSGNCVGGGSGGAPNSAAYLTIGNNGTLTNERAITAGTNISIADAGANSTYTISVSNSPTFSGLITASGGLTVAIGQALTVNGDAFTDLTGTGLQITGGALQTTLGTSVDLATSEVTGTLPVGNGGTGTTTFASKGIIFGNGGSALSVTAAAPNSVLVTDGSNNPSLSQTLPTVVQDNITRTGALASGSIATGFGAISTGNNITTTANIQGANVNATTGINTGSAGGTQRIDASGNLVNIGTITSGLINGQTISSTGNFTGTLTVQGAGGLTIGTTGVQGNLVLNTTGAGSLTLQSSSQSGNRTVAIPTIASDDTVCLLTLANCVGAGGAVSTTSGVQNYLSKYNNVGATQLTASLVYDNGTGVAIGSTTTTGLLNVGTSAQFQVSNAGNVTAGTITSGLINGQTISSTGNFTGTLAVQGAGGLTLGVAGTTAGALKVANSSNSNLITIAGTAPAGGNVTISFPGSLASGTDTFCLQTANNCTGAATSLQSAYTNSTGGTTPEIKLDGTRGGVDIQDANTTIGANLLNVRASNGSGLGTILFGVGNTGNTRIATSTNSGSAFQVQNSTGGAVINVDTDSNTFSAGNTYYSTGTIAQTGATITGTGTSWTSGMAGGMVVYADGSTATIYTVNSATQLTVSASKTVTAGSSYTIRYGGLDVYQVGAARLQTTTNTSQAFQIQNAAGSNLFQIDTANNAITIGGNNSGSLTSWTSSLTMNVARAQPKVVAYNGYIYATGGYDAVSTVLASTESTKINSDGSLGTWNPTLNMGSARARHGLVAANGYLYAIGGTTNLSNALATTERALINSDGTLGAWTSAGMTSMGTARSGLTAVVANGYIYAIGGNTGSGAGFTSTERAKINADGTLGAWTSAGMTSMGTARVNHSSIVANGYIYAIGGSSNGTNAIASTERAKINADGTLGAWTSAGMTSMGTARHMHGSAVSNGYVYSIGGGGFPDPTVEYARLNSDGTLGGWIGATSMTVNRTTPGSVVANGYIYAIGGSFTNTTEYTSTQRIKVGGALDLVGLGGANLADGETGTGGELTAGNTNIIGALQVQGQVSFARGLTVNGTLNVADQVAFKNATNSTTAFQVQNAAGSDIFTVDTTNSKIGTANGATSNVLTIKSGDASAGASGVVTLASGTGTTGTGILSLQSGNASAGPSGNFTLQSGTGTTGTGTGSLLTGNASAGASGALTVSTGTGTTGTGALTISTGNSSTVAGTSGALTIDTGSTNAGTSGNISIGTGAYAHNTTIGNATGSSTVTLQSGTGGIVASSTATTGYAMALTANALTTGNGLSVTTNSNNISSSNLFNASHAATYYSSNNISGNTLNASRVLTAASGVQFESTSTRSPATYGPGTMSWNHTVGTNANRALTVSFMAASSANNFNNTCTATYGGVSMTQLKYISKASVGSTDAYVFGLVNPSSGTAQVAITCNRASEMAVGSSSSWYNVDVSTGNTSAFPAAGSVSTTGTGLGPVSLTPVGSTSLDVIVDALGVYLGGTTPNSNQVTTGPSPYTSSYKFVSNGGTVGWSGFTYGSYGYSYAAVLIKSTATPTLTVSGSLANLSSTCSVSAGATCTDTSNILNINQQYASSTGVALKIQNAGSGGAILAQSTSTSALTIQDAGGTSTLLNADTTNMRVSVGSKGTATGQLYIAGQTPSAVLGQANGALASTGIAVQGRYAYTVPANGTNGYLQVYDVSNPAAPVYVDTGTPNKTTTSSAASGKRVKVQGKYAYVAGGGTLQVFDISNPYAPVSVGTQTYTSTGQTSLYVQGRYAYVSSGTTQALYIFDISNPASIPTATTLSSGFGTTSVGAVDIYAQGRYVYVANNSTTNAFQVIDMSNPSAPSVTASLSSVTGSPLSMTVQGRYAYLGTTSNLYAIDISNPASLTSSNISLGGPATTLTSQSRYVYVGDSTNGLIRTVDISIPSTPVLVSGTVTAASPYSMQAIGRHLYVSNNSATNTIQTFDLGGAYAQQLEVGGVESDTLNVRGNANFASDTAVQGSLTVGTNAQIQGNVSISGETKLTGNLVANNYATSTTATTSGTGTDTTTLTFSGTTSFANNDVLFIDNAGQDYYTRIVSGGTAASVTVSPAVTFETGRTVTKYVVQNIGTSLTGPPTTNADRFFQGYFLGGVVTGAGSTTLSDNMLQSTGTMNYIATGHSFTNTATTSSGLALTANSLTTGNGLSVTSSSTALSSGNILNVTHAATYTTTTTLSGSIANFSRSITPPQNPAVTLDAIGTKGTGNTTTSSSVTVGNNSNRVLLITLGAWKFSGAIPSCSVTYNGNGVGSAGLALLDSRTHSGTYGWKQYTWGVTNPTVGGASIAFSCSNSDQISGISSSWYNVDQTTPFAGINGASSIASSGNTSVSGTTTRDMVVDTFGGGAGTITLDGTAFGDAAASNPYNRSSYKAGSAGSTTTNWSGTQSGQYVYSALAIKALASQTLSVTGPAVNISSNCTAGAGTCTDSSNVVKIAQSATAATGTALLVQNAGTGAGFEVQNASSAVALSVSTANLSAGGWNASMAVLRVAKDTGTNRSISAAGAVDAGGLDYAEYIPWTGVKPDPGTIISYHGQSMVVSSVETAAFIGSGGLGDTTDALLVAFAGQVPVKISGPVNSGDYLVPNGDGTARGVAPASATLNDYVAKVGTALESTSASSVKALVSGPGSSSEFNPQASNSFADLNVSGTLTVNNLTVTGSANFQGNIIVGGHVITAGNTPSTLVLGAAGAGATITIDGNDTSGTITITTGAGATAGDLGKLIFASPFGSAPKTILSAQDDASQDAKIFPTGKSTTQFTLRSSQILPAGTYTFDYFIIQ